MLENIPSTRQVVPQHDGYITIKGNHKNKPVIGVIRNPWDWYVSLYHFHLPSKGSFMYPIIEKGGSFKGFLKLFLNKEKGRIHDINFDWLSNMNVGPYSYRVIKCFNKNGLNIKSIGDCNFNVVNIIKMENLVPNFINVLNEKGITLSDEIINELKSKDKVNTSDHKDYRQYYDDECAELVSIKDRLIIKEFNYEF
jgi:hypothetical protein